MLCSACESLFAPGSIEISESKTLDYNPRFKHHPSGRALKDAAIGGCLLCLRVWESLSETQRGLLCREDNADCSRNEDSKEVANGNQELSRVTGQIQRFVRSGCYKFDFVCGSVKWHFLTSSSTKADEQDNERSSWQEADTSAESAMAQAEDWLKNCLERHDCGKQTRRNGAQEQWYPTRLIDVGTYDKSNLQLVSSEDIPRSCLYMTLSHCWGLTPIFRLLSSNLDILHTAIPWDSLALTFRNAITVTRRLGIQYLWIDSLCIIQDSPADWLHEGTLMGKVYKYSHCNIAATGAPDGQHGLFTARDPNMIRPLKVRFLEEVQKEKTVSRRLTLEQRALDRLGRAHSKQTYAEWHDIVDPDMWTKSINQAPLNRRAWVAQEVPATLYILHTNRL